MAQGNFFVFRKNGSDWRRQLWRPSNRCWVPADRFRRGPRRCRHTRAAAGMNVAGDLSFRELLTQIGSHVEIGPMDQRAVGFERIGSVRDAVENGAGRTSSSSKSRLLSTSRSVTRRCSSGTLSKRQAGRCVAVPNTSSRTSAATAAGWRRQTRWRPRRESGLAADGSWLQSVLHVQPLKLDI